VLIRTATSQDWPEIFPIFGAVVASGESYSYPDHLTSDQAHALWFEQPPGRCVVALDEQGTVIGTAKMGPNRPGRGSHVATASFMVDPTVRRSGAGRALGKHVIGWARANGYRGIQFNAVVETNVAAVNLWQSLGFSIIGTVPAAFDHATEGLVGLHVMYLPL
jgi:L-amino acid N-acyltransferase YncA